MKFFLYILTFLVLMSFRSAVNNNSDKIKLTRDTLIDFDIEVPGKIATGFYEEANTCGLASNWTIYDDKGNGVMTPHNLGATDCINITTYTTPCKNFTVTAKIKSAGGEKHQGGGIVCRYVDNKNYYRAGYDPLQGNFKFYKMVKGVEEILQTSSCAITTGYWYTMSIEINNHHFRCWLNGENLAELDDKTFNKEGKFGLWTKGDAVTYFDEFVILPEKKRKH